MLSMWTVSMWISQGACFEGGKPFQEHMDDLTPMYFPFEDSSFFFLPASNLAHTAYNVFYLAQPLIHSMSACCVSRQPDVAGHERAKSLVAHEFLNYMRTDFAFVWASFCLCQDVHLQSESEHKQIKHCLQKSSVLQSG